MRIQTRFLSCLAVVASIFMVQAANASSAEDLNTLLNSIKTMKASFTQSIFDNYGKVVQKTYGTMALDRPGRFRWQVQKPMPQTIIANQDKIYIYDPDLEQMTVRRLTVDGNEAPALLLSHKDTTIDQTFDVSIMQGESALKWFLLKPKDDDAMFSTIKLGFVKNQIKEMELNDQIGHSTRVVFKNIKTNGKLPDKLFKLDPPKGTDVIDETKKS